ncbi:MAG: 4Fe-4S binding protein [Candidatus Sericytochromatia bacterium]|nr:4Fe-4S binding protein [Candidatus Tanganyikabacteria bacterium]
MPTLEKLFHPLIAEGPYFKLICGATFRDYTELTHLSTIYTLAGAKLVDVAATLEAVEAALAGVRRARRLGSAWLPQPPVPLVMVSVGNDDDPHVQVAVQDESKCTQVCPFCKHACPHEAIDEELHIIQNRCVGCTDCVAACPEDAIRMERVGFDVPLHELWDAGARALELHIGSGEGYERWEEPVRKWCDKGGLFSLSINAVQMAPRKAISVAKKIQKWIDSPIIVQADGKPISGEPGEASTTPAVEFAAKLIAGGVQHVQCAGGANDLTGRMAKDRGVALAGVGVGSYARTLVRDIKGLGDPNGGMSEALSRARRLVASVNPLFEEK